MFYSYLNNSFSFKRLANCILLCWSLIICTNEFITLIDSVWKRLSIHIRFVLLFRKRERENITWVFFTSVYLVIKVSMCKGVYSCDCIALAAETIGLVLQPFRHSHQYKKKHITSNKTMSQLSHRESITLGLKTRIKKKIQVNKTHDL